MWYTTEDAKRDAERQAAQRKNNLGDVRMSMQGWELIDSIGEVETYRHEKYGIVSINTKRRIAAIGAVIPRGHNSIFPNVEYIGRGWKSRLLADACAEAERRWE